MTNKQNITPLQRVLSYFDAPLMFSYFGLGFAFCWSHATQRLVYNNQDGMFQVVQYLGTVCICLLFYLIAKRKNMSLSTKRSIQIIGAILGLACSPLIVLPGVWQSSQTLVLIIGFISGALLGLLYLMWASFYQMLDIKVSILILCGTLILSSLIKVFIDSLGHDISGVLACAMLPLASILCLNHAKAKVSPPDQRKNLYISGEIYKLKDMSIGVFLFSFAIGLFMAINLEIFTMPLLYKLLTQILTITLGAGIVIAVYKRQDVFSPSKIWFFVLLMIATGLVAATINGGVIGHVSLALFTVAQLAVIAFLWLILSDVSHNSLYPSDMVFGIGWSLYALPIALGLFTPRFFPTDFDQRDISLGVLYLLMIAMFFFINKHQPGDLHLFSDLKPTHLKTDRFVHQVALFSKHYDLTVREQEVVVLYAQGRSRAYISSQYVISENTVRDHIQKVYKKAAIHNKQELIDTILLEK